jgi:release factor glutamine methyltransferase
VRKKGALVTASDLSGWQLAPNSIRRTSISHHHHKEDLFGEIPKQQFDFIVINPPYFPENPTNEVQLSVPASTLNTLKKLSQLRAHNPACKVLMILSRMSYSVIEQIAQKMIFEECERKKIWWELNFI